MCVSTAYKSNYTPPHLLPIYYAQTVSQSGILFNFQLWPLISSDTRQTLRPLNQSQSEFLCIHCGGRHMHMYVATFFMCLCVYLGIINGILKIQKFACIKRKPKRRWHPHYFHSPVSCLHALLLLLLLL